MILHIVGSLFSNWNDSPFQSETTLFIVGELSSYCGDFRYSGMIVSDIEWFS